MSKGPITIAIRFDYDASDQNCDNLTTFDCIKVDAVTVTVCY